MKNLKRMVLVVLAGLMGALKLQGKSVSELKNQRFLIAGAGSAGIGVATALSDAMVLHATEPADLARRSLAPNLWRHNYEVCESK